MFNDEWSFPKSLYYTYACGWTWVTKHFPVGTNVFERDWDVLLVLDSCRIDLITEVADEYSFIESIDSIWSVGSITTEWMSQTFRPKYRSEIQETAFLSASPHTKTVFEDRSYLTSELPLSLPFPEAPVLTPSEFQIFDEVWQYGHDDGLGVVPPRPVTERAIDVGRKHDPNRMIVHYMQPHEPFIESEIETTDLPVWEALRTGAVRSAEVWEAYSANLRLVLQDVSLLLANLDAENVILTADHGNMFGEWGIFGHPIGFPHPAVRRVPWVETSAEDSGSYETDITPRSKSDGEVENKLEQLGYIG